MNERQKLEKRRANELVAQEVFPVINWREIRAICLIKFAPNLLWRLWLAMIQFISYGILPVCDQTLSPTPTSLLSYCRAVQNREEGVEIGLNSFILSVQRRSEKLGMTMEACVLCFFGGKTFQKRRVSSPAPVTSV